MLTLNLDSSTAKVKIRRVTQVQDRRGRIGTKQHDFECPEAIHLGVGCSSEHLPDAVLRSTEVANAIARGDIKVLRVPDAPQAESVTDASEPAAAPATATRVSEGEPKKGGGRRRGGSSK